MKLYRKRSTKIILFFFLLFLILGGILARTSYSPPTGDWQTQLKQENLNLEQERSLPKGNRPSLEQIDNQIAENNYRLVHDLSPLGSETAAQLTQDMSNFFILAIVFALMTSGSV